MLALKPTFKIDEITTTLSGDGTLAVTRMKGSMQGTDANGKRLDNNFSTLEVVRRQKDGTWRFVIDDPYGGK